MLFLGIDGGQSSTTALIGDETGRVAGYGRGGPCNHVGAAEGRAKFMDAIGGCVAAACVQARVDPVDVEYEMVCAGFSGGPADKRTLLAELVHARKFLVTDDALIALSGATAGEPGIITIAGTGSIAYGRNGAGKMARAGGWGYIYGDEGGGFDTTRQALRAMLRMEEGWGPPTSLHSRLLEATGARNANDLLHRFYTSEFTRPVIASFAKIVDQAAIEGDAVAHRILMNAAQSLAEFTAAVRGRLFQPGEKARVAYIGGVFQCDLVRERYRQIVEMEEGNTLGPPVYLPAAGALLEAYRAAGLTVSLSNVPERGK